MICWIEEDCDFELIGFVVDGEQGFQCVKELQLDLIVFDVEMLKMDGFVVFFLLLKVVLICKVVMVLILICCGGEVMICVLLMGVVDYMLKFQVGCFVGVDEFCNMLISKFKVFVFCKWMELLMGKVVQLGQLVV